MRSIWERLHAFFQAVFTQGTRKNMDATSIDCGGSRSLNYCIIYVVTIYR